MIHNDKSRFSELVDRIASQTGFYAPLMEKDYYLTLILSRIYELSDKLVFKGGTCLNKIYYAYYRLSEDLDFSMQLPDEPVTRSIRRKVVQPVKDKIESFAAQFGMRIDSVDHAGSNESRQYIFSFVYDSVIVPTEQTIKFEIGLRFNPVQKTVPKPVRHKFVHAFTGEPLFEAGTINCLSLNEIVSEKLRAAALRPKIAPRDFYDIDFIIRNGFDLARKEVMILFLKKVEEDGGDPDISRYGINLGRSDKEIQKMRSRIDDELLGVLTVDERERFDLDKALVRINNAMLKTA